MIDKADAVVLQAVAEFRFQQHSSLCTRRTDQASHRGELRWLGRGPALSGVFSDVSEEEGDEGSEETRDRELTPQYALPGAVPNLVSPWVCTAARTLVYCPVERLWQVSDCCCRLEFCKLSI